MRENSPFDLRPDAKEILQEYLKAVDLLIINEENRLRRRIETQQVEYSETWEKTRKMVGEIRARLGLL